MQVYVVTNRQTAENPSGSGTPAGPYYEVPFAVHVYPVTDESAVASLAALLREPAGA